MASDACAKTRTGGRAATTAVIPGDFSLSVGNPETPLPEGWRWTLLTDLARLESGHTPSRRHPEYWGGDIPWIGIRDATANHGTRLYSTEQNTNSLGIENSSARVLPANTVCLSRTASVGYVVVMGRPMATSQDFVNWVCSEVLDYRFLKYVLIAERRSFSRFAHGTTHQTIYFPEVKAFHIALPPRPEQRAIAGVLSTLDDRIDNLRQANATLEATAQALFKSWFVDFDPARAKAEGREPEGMDAATAALFPSELEDSELGPIPKGWRVGTLEDVSDLNASKWTARKHPEVVKYIDLSGVSRNRIETLTEFEFDAAPSRARNHLREGDTIVGTVRPGNRAYAYIHAPDENLTGSTGFAVLSPKKPHLSSFVYLAATSDEAIDRLTNLADGAAYPAVRPGVVASTPCILPSDSVLAAFAEISVPMLEGIAKNSTRAGVLAELRDTLLPRLISGKLRLSCAPS